MKKIVIIPCFAESHFTELQIYNLIDTINPDIIIYNEGLFPKGPENKGGIDDSFRNEFCYENTNLAWDTKQLQQTIDNAQLKYPNKKIIWNPMDYSDIDANNCYIHSVSNFNQFDINIEHPTEIIKHQNYIKL